MENVLDFWVSMEPEKQLLSGKNFSSSWTHFSKNLIFVQKSNFIKLLFFLTFWIFMPKNQIVKKTDKIQFWTISRRFRKFCWFLAIFAKLFARLFKPFNLNFLVRNFFNLFSNIFTFAQKIILHYFGAKIQIRYPFKYLNFCVKIQVR